jgi:integrase
MPRIKSKYSSKTLLENPTFYETIKRLEQTPMKPHAKATLSLLCLLGIRVGELLMLKKKHIVFFSDNGLPIPLNETNEDLSNVSYIVVEVRTLKQRSNKVVLRRPVVPVNQITLKLLGDIRNYLVELDSDEKLVWPFKDVALRRQIKRNFSVDFYPHLFRHIAATRDGLANMNIHALKKKYGWSNIDNASFYIQLNAKDLFDEESKIYALDRIGPCRSKRVEKKLESLKQKDSVVNSEKSVGSVEKKRVVFKF